MKFIYVLGGGGLVTKSCLTLAIPWTAARQAPLSMGLPRQEYWSGLPLPFPGDLPDPGIEPKPPALQADFLLAIRFSLTPGHLRIPSLSASGLCQSVPRQVCRHPALHVIRLCAR